MCSRTQNNLYRGVIFASMWVYHTRKILCLCIGYYLLTPKLYLVIPVLIHSQIISGWIHLSIDDRRKGMKGENCRREIDNWGPLVWNLIRNASWNDFGRSQNFWLCRQTYLVVGWMTVHRSSNELSRSTNDRRLLLEKSGNLLLRVLWRCLMDSSDFFHLSTSSERKIWL